jgi:uncharacterized phiE125 gp8 family phage protein
VANPKTVTGPAVEPVTTDEAKKQARIPHTADDTYVVSLIVTAREAVENFLNRRLINTTLDYFRDNFPWDSSEIELPGGRLQSITSLKYTDSDNVENTVASSLYFAATADEHGALRLAYNAVWPSATLKPAEAVVVRYVVGYGTTAATVPADIRHGILLMVASLYNDRGDEDKFTAGAPPKDMPVAAQRLLWPHRIETRF